LAGRAEAAVRRSLSLPLKTTSRELPPPQIRIVFDPTVLEGFRSAMRSMLELVLLEVEIRAQVRFLGQLMPQSIAARLPPEFASAADGLMGETKSFRFDLAPQRLVAIEESAASESLAAATPTSVQHNVPAWALFGIFLIAVPIAGSLIQERRSGIDTRLFSLPVPLLTLLSGKLLAYCIVCGFQFLLILLIGKFLLPALGTPPFDTGSSPAGIVLMTVCAILAANGFGVLLGTLGKTYEQVSMLGPTAIVVAAALGGVMVPVYAMPEVMQKISVLSPLAWGLNGFLEIFIRRGTVGAVLPEALSLLAFFAFCMLVSGAVLGRDDRRSG
jgi:ABC-2 type transport system permease protein